MYTLTEKIALDLKLDRDYIEKIVNSANRYYKEYTIPKKNGGQREIAQASPELKSLQYWVRENILQRIKVSSASCAYAKGSSIKEHSLKHIGSRYFLHADIRNFFPSITPRHLLPQLEKHPEIFADLGVDMNDALAAISKICFRKGRLCIGTVSSPMISNIVMIDLDKELDEHFKAERYVYTRYADDMYISSQRFIPKAEREYLVKILGKYGFVLNYGKTYFASKKGRRSVTGIIITDGGALSIGPERKREIRKMIYDKLVKGKGDSDEILGHLAFVKDIEPDYYNKLIIKYSTYCKDDIVSSLKRDEEK